MRRNILTYKAPRNHEGFDLSCVHNDPSKATKHIRVQVKSRCATDCERWVPIAAKSLDAFDFLVVAFMNAGEFSPNRKAHDGRGGADPEFFTFPQSFVREHHRQSAPTARSKDSKAFEWLDIKTLETDPKIDIGKYRDASGFELIANALGIEAPSRPTPTARKHRRKAPIRKGRKPEPQTKMEQLNEEIEKFERSLRRR